MKYDILGKTVTVTVDRPLGSSHPQYPDSIYPVNYGYADGIVAGDGEFQDVYIIGVDTPCETFEGEVIAVIERLDDNEDKWVAVPTGTIMYEPEMKAKMQFTEQYFKSIFHCLYEKACGGVLYRWGDNKPEYILIENESLHIGFPKGHIEQNETERQTAIREIYEETGIMAELTGDFRREFTITKPNGVIKNYVYFIAEYKGQVIAIQQSEILRHFIVDYDGAMKLLNFTEDRDILTAAHAEIIRSRG